MKIEGPGKTQSSAPAKKSGRVSGGGNFGDFLTDAPAQAAGARATQSIALVDSLLAVQVAENPAEKSARRRTIARAGTVLNELDKIRLALLNGTLTLGHMIDIADVVASHRDHVSDPALTALMDEIDLRAQVEVAKMRYIIDSKR